MGETRSENSAGKDGEEEGKEEGKGKPIYTEHFLINHFSEPLLQKSLYCIRIVSES